MAAPKLPGELTWPKLLGTSVAAVVAAWLGGHLGLGGTLSGIAIGSLIATFSTAFFTTTIDKTHQVIPTVLVRTDRGTVVEGRGDEEVAVEGGDRTAVMPAASEPPPLPPSVTSDHKAPSRWSQIHWKSVAIASLLTIAITVVAISLYESAVGRTWGSNEPGTTIGNTVHGGHPVFQPTDTPTAEPTPTDEPSESPSPSEPSESPTPTTSASPTPTATTTACPTPTASPSNQPSPDASSTACPTPTTSPSEDTGLLR